MVIDQGTIPEVIRLAREGKSFALVKEACWVIANLAITGAPDQVVYLASQGGVSALIEGLRLQHESTVQCCLEGLQALFQSSSGPDLVQATPPDVILATMGSHPFSQPIAATAESIASQFYGIHAETIHGDVFDQLSKHYLNLNLDMSAEDLAPLVKKLSLDHS